MKTLAKLRQWAPEEMRFRKAFEFSMPRCVQSPHRAPAGSAAAVRKTVQAFLKYLHRYDMI
jgi:hypothetical protein